MSILCFFLILPTLSPSQDEASPICHPRGPPQFPKATKNAAEITRFSSAGYFVGYEEDRQIISTLSPLFLILPTPAPSRGGASYVYHPRGPSWSQIKTNSTTTFSKFGSAGFFLSNEENSHFISMVYQVGLIFLFLSHSWGHASLIHHPRGSSQSPQATRNTLR